MNESNKGPNLKGYIGSRERSTVILKIITTMKKKHKF